jgi:mRNA-degrading endonuclease RelE of RelBE toxin-antitoxin system
MKVYPKPSALKDLAKYTEPAKSVIKVEIKRLEEVQSLGEMGNVEKLTGSKNLYKIKKDDFRIILEKTKEDIKILIISDRKDVYKRLKKTKLISIK